MDYTPAVGVASVIQQPEIMLEAACMIDVISRALLEWSRRGRIMVSVIYNAVNDFCQYVTV